MSIRNQLGMVEAERRYETISADRVPCEKAVARSCGDWKESVGCNESGTCRGCCVEDVQLSFWERRPTRIPSMIGPHLDGRGIAVLQVLERRPSWSTLE